MYVLIFKFKDISHEKYVRRNVDKFSAEFKNCAQVEIIKEFFISFPANFTLTSF